MTSRVLIYVRYAICLSVLFTVCMFVVVLISCSRGETFIKFLWRWFIIDFPYVKSPQSSTTPTNLKQILIFWSCPMLDVLNGYCDYILFNISLWYNQNNNTISYIILSLVKWSHVNVKDWFPLEIIINLTMLKLYVHCCIRIG